MSYPFRIMRDASVVRFLLSVSVIFFLVFALIPVLQAEAATGTTTSASEAGYAITATAGSVKSVKGSFKVPSIVCPSGEVDFVVGMDNYPTWFFLAKANEVGVDARCSGSTAVYFAFYVTPGTNLIFLVNVKAGDVIRASVTYVNGVFSFALKDMTSGFAFSKSMGETGVSRSVAGWLVATAGGAIPNFGKFVSGFGHTAISGTDTASIGTHTGSIGSFAPIAGDTVLKIQMSASGTAATTSSLTNAGSSFTDTWS